MPAVRWALLWRDGRGIISALVKLEVLHAFETYKSDVVIYNALGDVAAAALPCPTGGYAREVYIFIKQKLYELGVRRSFVV